MLSQRFIPSSLFKNKIINGYIYLLYLVIFYTYIHMHICFYTYISIHIYIYTYERENKGRKEGNEKERKNVRGLH